MSDSIQSIRYIPPIHHVKHKGRADDKKGGKGDNQDFSDHMTSKDEDVRGKGSNHESEQHKNSRQRKLEDNDSLESRGEDDLDGSCGSILDAEV